MKFKLKHLDFVIAASFVLVTLIIYTVSNNGEGIHWNYHTRLADALLHGRLHFIENPPWLNELVLWEGRYYTVFPIMPAVLLIPFVATFGIDFNQSIFSLLLGSFNVGLSYLVFLKKFKGSVAFWLALLFGFGSIHWFHAEVGSAWYLAQIVSIFFIWLFLLEAFTKQRLFILGLLLGCSYLARLPTILGAIFIAVYLYDKFITYQNRKISFHFKNILLFGLGLFPGLIINWLYNYLRFGTLIDIGYQILLVNDPWHRDGVFSHKYILNRVKEFFTALPSFSNRPPFIIPSQYALAFWITMPAVFLVIFAKFKNRLTIACCSAILVIAIPSFAKGANGFTQFGFRYSLDYLPFLLLLIGMGIGEKVSWWAKLLIVLSIVVNAWGVIMISHFNIWTI